MDVGCADRGAATKERLRRRRTRQRHLGVASAAVACIVGIGGLALVQGDAAKPTPPGDAVDSIDPPTTIDRSDPDGCTSRPATANSRDLQVGSDVLAAVLRVRFEDQRCETLLGPPTTIRLS